MPSSLDRSYRYNELKSGLFVKNPNGAMLRGQPAASCQDATDEPRVVAVYYVRLSVVNVARMVARLADVGNLFATESMVM